MENKILTFDELQNLAQENYSHGGMEIVECWDEEAFNEYVEMFGPITYEKAQYIMGFYEETGKEREAVSNW